MDDESPPPTPADVLARWIVGEVKRALIEGLHGEQLREEWFEDVRALMEENLDEEALLQIVRSELSEALPPIIHKVIVRAVADGNSPP